MYKKEWRRSSPIAVVDSSGSAHQLDVDELWLEISTLDGGVHWQPTGSRRLRLHGRTTPVNLNDDGSFTRVDTGEQLRRA